MIVSYVVSPYVGLVVGGLSLIIRSSTQSIFGNLASVEINNNTESKYRSTTISTFNMIKNLPYILTAYFIGSISDILSAKQTSFYLGLILIVFLVIVYLVKRDKSNKFVTI
jgi:hypothetical protein